MTNAKNTSETVKAKKTTHAPRPTISTARWTSRSSHPRLVSLNWAGVSQLPTRR